MVSLVTVIIISVVIWLVVMLNPWQWQVSSTSRLGRLALVLFIGGILALATSNAAKAQTGPLLEITKDFGGSTALDVPSGEAFTYYIAYRCASIFDPCTNTIITDPLPPEVTYLGATGPANHLSNISYDSGTHSVIYEFIPSLPAGSTGILEVDARFPSGTLPGTTAVNQATSTTTGGDVDSQPVTATATGAFEMTINKAVANDFDDGVIGSDFTTNYSLNVCNPDDRGGVNLTNVTITDTLPPEATFVSASNGGAYDSGTHTITWTYTSNGGTLPDLIPVTSGCSLTLNVTVRFDPNGPDGNPATGDEPIVGSTVTNIMDIVGTPEDGSPDFVATDPVDLVLIEPYFDDSNGKSASSPSSYTGRPIEELPGGDVNYAVSYTNEGTITATNVTLTDVLPSQVRVQSIQISPVVDPASGFYETNNNPGVWLAFPGNGYVAGATVPVVTAVTATPNDIELAPGDYLTSIRWALGDVPPGTPTWSANIATIIDPGVAENVTFGNCATTFAAYVEGGTPGTSTNNECVNVTTIDVRAIPRVRKTVSDDSLLPGEVTQFTLQVYNPSVAHNNVIAPLTMADLLPERLEVVVADASQQSGYRLPDAQEILDGDWFSFSATDSAPAPTYVFTSTFNAANETLLRWQWPAPYQMAPGASITINFYARVMDYTVPQSLGNDGIILWDDGATNNALACDGSDGVNSYTDTDDVDQDSNLGELGCFVTTPVTVEAFLAMDSQKFVDGTLDVNLGWTDYDYTVAGGAVDWRMVITNTSNVMATNITAYDIFPYVGDTGTIDLSGRGSEWRPHLIAPITDTMGLPLTISYSQSTNPCRPELLASGPAGCTDDWSTTPPADITTVQAVRFEFCSGGTCLELPPDNGTGGGSLEFNWHMVAPNNTAVGDVAWNSFGFTAEGGGLKLLPSEPIRVGIELAANLYPGQSLGDYVWLDLYGQQDDGIQQLEELGLSGVRVELWNADTNTYLDFRTTGPDGNGDPGYYEFINILDGNYFIRFFQPQDGLTYTFSPGNQGGDDSVDSDGVTTGTDGIYGDYIETAPFTISGADDYTIDQGMWIEADYGDAPATYPTESASLGATPELAARHIISSTIYLGAGVDAELDGQPLANAWGDDNDGTDDEDGVTFEDYIGTAANPTAVMTIGDTNDIIVNTTVPAGTTGYLNAWIDFNGDGDWNDPGERIATNMPSTGGNLNLSVNPAATVTTGKTYARFRFSTEMGLLPTGTAIDGEVEDYVVQFVPQPVKSIIDSSEDHTSESPSHLAIGEIIRYRLQVAVPEGTMTNFQIQDRLPAGLQFMNDGTTAVSVTTDTSITYDPLTISGSPFNSGTDPIFNLGTVINNDDDTNQEYVTVEFNALLLNESNNTNDTTSSANRRRNDFDVGYNNYTDRSNRVDSYIVEPEVSIVKSVTTTPNDAGDTVVYQLVATNNTGTYISTAYDLTITDTLDSYLALGSVSIAAPGYATAVDNSNIPTNLVDVDINWLDPGDSVTVTVTATVQSTAPSGETIPNMGYLVYSSLPNDGTTSNITGTDTPGSSGDLNGERNGSGGVNDYNDTDNQDVTLAEPTFDKQVSPTTYTIGENITFDLLVTLPEGVTEDLVVVDDLPDGLGYVTHNIVTTAVGSGGLLAADFNGTLPAPTVSSPGGNGVDVSWDFGNTTTVGDNITNNNSFLIQVTAVVLDVFSNQTGDTLTNTGTLTYTRNGSSHDITDSQDVDLIEPVLTIDKSLVTPIPSPLDAGTVISYQIVLQHDASSLADAYDVVIADAIPSQLFNVTNVNVTAAGVAAPDFDLTGNDLRVPSTSTGTFDLVQGATVTVTFEATIGGTAVPGQVIDNTAAATWTSLDGTPPQERHGGATDPDGSDYYNNGTGSATNDYETAATESFTVDGVAFLKALTNTSAGHTAGSNVTLGEIVTYVITATVPEGHIPSLTIIDNLPPGLAYVSGTASYNDSSFSETLPVPVVTATGGSGDNVTWAFGTFDVTANNNPNDNSFTLTLQAVVMDVPGNVGITPQTVLTNVATVQVGSDTPTASNPVDVTVVEPQISITKDFDKTQVTPNESTVVTLVVENTGTSTAFDVVVEDPLANDTFTNITQGTTPTGWTFSTSVSGGNTIVRYDLDAGGTLPVGASETFTFTVTMDPDLTPSPPNVTNVATVTDASTLDSTVNDGDEDNATNIDEEREYTTNDNDDLVIIVPDLVLTKTDGVTYVSPGDVVVYDLNVENVGGADAAGVVITETVPANTTFNLANSSATWVGCADGAAAGTTCVLTISNLNSGANTTRQFAVNIDDPLPANTATITNTAVTGDDGTKGNDPTPPNNTDDETDTVTAAIGDYVWEDSDVDGTQDDGNTGINGVTVNLYRDDGDGIAEPGLDDGAPISTTVTINDGGGNPGYYVFDNLIPDDYFVEFVAPTGYAESPQDQGVDTADSDADVVTGVTIVTNLAPGERDMTWDAGYFQPVSLGNRVWLDANADGVQDVGETNIAGVELALFLADGTTPAVDVDGVAVAHETTDASGTYNFTNLPPGDYVVQVLASNWNAGNVFGTGGTHAGALGSPGSGADDQDNSDDNGNNDGIAALGTGVQSGVINLAINGEPTLEDAQETIADNDSDLTIDFGFYQPVTLGNRVWFDEDGDGVQDAGEPDIENVEVALFLSDGSTPAVDVAGTAVANVTTDVNGYYNFGNLPPGDYVVEITTANWNAGNVFGTGGTYEGAVGSPGVGADDQDNTDDNGDNDGTAALGTGVQSSVINLASQAEPTSEDGQETAPDNNSDLTIDFGFYQPVSIGNRVWFDENGDGTQDTGEPDIEDVAVALFLADGTTPAVDIDGNPIANVTTDVNGYYNFSNLPPGGYVVEMIAANWSASNVFGTGGTYEGAVGSPGVGADDQDNADDNGDNDGTAASSGVQSSVITLTSNNEPTSEDVQETVANNNSDLTIDFGVYQPVSLGNRVWFDIDADGVQDAGEIGIPGVEVALFLADGTTPARDVDNALLGLRTTDASGYYNFGNLPPGTYVVEIGANNWTGANAFGPTGAYANALGSPGVGADNQTNTDDNGNNDGTAASAGVQSAVITLLSNDQPTLEDAQETVADNNSDLTIDFGFYLPVSLGNRVWFDTNANGVQDAGENGIQNVEVALFLADGTTPATDMNGTTVANISTDASGFYNFNNLPPGNYVVEVVSTNWNAGNVFGTGGTYENALGSPGVGADDQDNTDDNGDNDGTAASAGVQSSVIALRSAQEPVDEDVQETVSNNNSDLTIDFGFYQLASIGDYVWLDANQDGLQDSDEFGVPNVTVTLYDTTNAVISTTTTNAYGYYNFIELTPDDYYIVVTLPAGYTTTPQDANANVDDTVDSDIDGTGRTANTTLDSNEDDPTWDAGLYIDPASIGDFVWLDANQDGIQDGGELGIGSVTVELYDSNDNLIDTTTTLGDGSYGFTNLPPGDYYIIVTPPIGYSISPQDQTGDTADSDIDGTGQTIVTTLTSGEDDPTWDAGLYILPASLGDLVWLDANQDGVQDAGEYGVPGVTVNLYDSSDTFIATTTTDAVGNYSFTNLAPADYHIEVVPPAGYTITSQDQGGDDALDSDINTSTGLSINTNLTSGEDDPTWDAGLYIDPASIGDYVWLDANQDGIQAGDEYGIGGVTVELYDSGDNLIDTTITDSNGGYSFTNLPPGDYYVVVTPPAGYTIVAQDQGADDTADSDIDGSGQTTTTTLDPNEDDPTWDAGLYAIPASLGDTVWLDANQDGIQDADEYGVPGVTVNLYDSGDTFIGTTTTDALGLYGFSNLPPGDYYVEVVPLAGYTITLQDQGGNDTADSDIDTGTGQTIVTNLASGENDPTWDGGLYIIPASLGDLVWLDANQDGVQDSDEFGVPNVTVNLYDASDNLLDTTTTDAYGQYGFSNLPPADYYVEVVPPAGYTVTLQDQGADDTVDSDIDSITGQTIVTNLTSGENDPTWDGGLYAQPASLGDYVWLDANLNGTQDFNEGGVIAVTVSLYDGSGNLLDSTATNATGFYEFTNLPPGDYYVAVTLPNGYAFTTQDGSGNDATDSDVNTTTGQTIVTTLVAGENDPTWDAGLVPAISSLGDYVWEDLNSDGIQNVSEPGVPGVEVHLYDITNTQIMTTTTDVNGRYQFIDLTPGTYYVEFVLPIGYNFTQQDQGGDSADSDADPATGLTISTNLTPGENDVTWDAGLVRPLNPLLAAIGNYVWEDLDSDGIQDAGEPGVENVTVNLYDGGGFVDTITTDANGLYQFIDLTPGDYRVEFILPAGYDFSLQDQGANDAIDSDADTATGLTIPTNLVAGENDTTWDAGLIQPLNPALAAIGNYVWLDANENGMQDISEPGVENVTVNLYESNNVLAGTTTTNANGLYQFIDLTPGDYYVEFVPPNGYVLTGQDMGDDALDSDADANIFSATFGQTISTNLVAGENDTTWDAGLYVPSAPSTASLGDFVWLDANVNGIQDSGEGGVNAVTVNLYTGGNVLVDTTTTDGTGFYQFTNLLPGDYYVAFVPPTGYALTLDNSGVTDLDDSDADPVTGQTAVTTLTAGESDPTWDAGLYQTVRLGNRVWFDVNNNGLLDGGEQGVPSVQLELLDGVGNPVILPATGLPLTTITDATGRYVFNSLPPGTYIVRVAASNFAGWTDPLYGFVSSRNNISPDPAADPDTNNSDLDDNGRNNPDPANGGIVSYPVTVTVGNEPTNEGTDEDGSYANADSNLTVDFGFFELLTLGNYIWLDNNENSIIDTGEPGVGGVVVYLLDGNGNPVLHPVTHQPISTLTNQSGFYQFTNLYPGEYRVLVGAENFQVSGALEGYWSSLGAVDPDDNSDVDDNGLDEVEPWITGIVSDPVSLNYDQEPRNNDDTDDNDNTNLTVDMGFVATPTAVTLTSFTATNIGNRQVRINWTTASEVDNFGFRIYRSSSNSFGGATEIHFEATAVFGGTGPGASYSYTDTVPADGTYYYWLVDVETENDTAVHGPLTVVVSPFFNVYLPLVMGGN